MWINGRWYTESEVKSLLDVKDRRIAELEDKHWNECRQIAHYDDERKKIKEYLRHSAKTMTVHGVHEALELIGEDGDTP